MWNAKHLLFYVVILISAALSIAFAFLSTFGDRISKEYGSIWVTAFSAVGTLGAVWAAVRATQKSEDQAERIRHEAVRPIASIRSIEWFDYGSDDERSARVKLEHVAGGHGFQLRVALVDENGASIWLDPSTEESRVLRPTTESQKRSEENARAIEELYKRLQMNAKDLVAQARNPYPLFQARTSRSKGSVPFTVRCYFVDSLGWQWMQESYNSVRLDGSYIDAELKLPMHEPHLLGLIRKPRFRPRTYAAKDGFSDKSLVSL